MLQNSVDGNVIKKEAEKILQYKDLGYKHSACGVWKESDTSNNGGNRNHLKDISENT